MKSIIYHYNAQLRTAVVSGFNPTSPLDVFQYSQMVRYAASMILSVIIARSALSVEVIGQYELTIFIIAAATTFWSAGIKNALLSRFASVSPDARQKELQSVFFLLFILSGLTAIMVYIFFGHLDFLNRGQVGMPSVYLVCGMLFFSVPCLMTENVLYLEKRSVELKKYAIWSHGSLIILMAAVAFISPSLDAFFMVLLIWNFIRCIYLIVQILPSFDGLPNRSQLKDLMLFSGPLIIQAFLGQLMELTDGFMVSHFFSDAEFAIYRYGARELPFAALIFSSLSAAFIPIYQSEPSAILQLKEKATLWMHRLFIPALILMMLSPFLFKWVYGTVFQASSLVFNIYLLILLSRVFLPQTINFALHQHRILLFATGSEIVINIILSLWWLQIWGLTGLVAATAVAYAFEKLILIVYNYRYNQISPASYIDIRWYLGYAVIFLMLTVLMFIWNL